MSYGEMVSFDDAVRWVDANAPDCYDKDRVLNRMKYEADKAHPLEPTYHKGIYGRKFDTYTCGKCGHVIPGATWNYCANCGRRITDCYLGRRKTQEEQDKYRQRYDKPGRMPK